MEFIGIWLGAIQLLRVVKQPAGGSLSCQRCQRNDLYEDDFAKCKSRKTGRAPTCKECRKIQERARWDKLHPDKKKAHYARSKEYKKKHLKRIRSHNRRYAKYVGRVRPGKARKALGPAEWAKRLGAEIEIRERAKLSDIMGGPHWPEIHGHATLMT